MTIYFSNKFICDFCPKKIDTPEDGFIIFGAVCLIGERGLKAKIGEVPNDQNINQFCRTQTCICKGCFVKRLMPSPAAP